VTEPVSFELHLSLDLGTTHQFDQEWIAWASTTQAPAVGGVDHALDPVFHDGEGETRYA
jgi:hypothetical protein